MAYEDCLTIVLLSWNLCKRNGKHQHRNGSSLSCTDETWETQLSSWDEDYYKRTLKDPFSLLSVFCRLSSIYISVFETATMLITPFPLPLLLPGYGHLRVSQLIQVLTIDEPEMRTSSTEKLVLPLSFSFK